MAELRIDKVETAKALNDFVTLPWKIYQDDQCWVPPLIADFKNTINKDKNPFFCHAQQELFIAYKNSEPVGRIAAIVDYNYCKYHGDNIGFFGFFESINDQLVADELFSAAIKSLKSKSMKKMFGPANPSMNDEAGLLIQGFDSPPTIKMAYNPQYYIDLIERAGLKKAKDLYAYSVDVQREPPPKLVRIIEALKSRKDIKVRYVNLRHLKSDLVKIKEIYNDAWRNNWDFAPMTEPEIDNYAKQLKPLIVPELVPIVEVNGEPAGMSIGLPDYNQVLKHLNGKLFPFGFIKFLKYKNKIDAARLWALGVKDKFRMMGIDALLYYETFIGAKGKGYKKGEVSWILEDNTAIIRPILLWDAKLYKIYRVYQIPIV